MPRRRSCNTALRNVFVPCIFAGGCRAGTVCAQEIALLRMSAWPIAGCPLSGAYASTKLYVPSPRRRSSPRCATWCRAVGRAARNWCRPTGPAISMTRRRGESVLSFFQAARQREGLRKRSDGHGHACLRGRALSGRGGHSTLVLPRSYGPFARYGCPAIGWAPNPEVSLGIRCRTRCGRWQVARATGGVANRGNRGNENRPSHHARAGVVPELGGVETATPGCSNP